MKLRTCFLVLGGAIFLIASTFFMVGLTPSRLIRYPKYSKADLPQVAKSCKTISEEEQEHLLASLQKFEHLFDGTLGTWNTEPVDLELKDPNCKPCHAKPYPVPHAHEQLLKEEMDRLCNYGVVRKINSSEWASPVFTVPKSDNTLRSIGDSHKKETFSPT